MLICDQCMDCCHIEDHIEEPCSIAHGFNICRCDLCLRDCARLYEMENEHIRELMKKYKQLLAGLDLVKLLDE